MVDAQVQPRNKKRDDDSTNEKGVELQVLDEAALLSEEPHLHDGNNQKHENNHGQCGSSARLLLEVMLVEALNGNEAEGIIVHRANPTSSKPEDRLLNLSRKALESASHTHLVVHDPSHKHGWQELAQQV